MIGWVTDVAQADAFFEKRLSSNAWLSAIKSDQTASLWSAYYRLIDCKDYTLSPATPTSEELRRAQYEMAYYMLKHLSAEDHRLGLQAQGVIEAGVIKEVYKKDMEVAIPAIVDDILDKLGVKKYLVGFKRAAIGRDDSKDLDEKITEYSEN